MNENASGKTFEDRRAAIKQFYEDSERALQEILEEKNIIASSMERAIVDIEAKITQIRFDKEKVLALLA